jgi:hypothetical protein
MIGVLRTTVLVSGAAVLAGDALPQICRQHRAHAGGRETACPRAGNAQKGYLVRIGDIAGCDSELSARSEFSSRSARRRRLAEAMPGPSPAIPSFLR